MSWASTGQIYSIVAYEIKKPKEVHKIQACIVALQIYSISTKLSKIGWQISQSYECSNYSPTKVPLTNTSQKTSHRDEGFSCLKKAMRVAGKILNITTPQILLFM